MNEVKLEIGSDLFFVYKKGSALWVYSRGAK